MHAGDGPGERGADGNGAVTPAFRIPVISLHGTLIVSIQVALSDVLVEQLKDDVAVGLERAGARGLAIDLSGVDLLDSYLARALRDLALIAGVMGVPTVICGMDPATAVTLVEMGLDMGRLQTALDLESALDQLALAPSSFTPAPPTPAWTLN